MDEVPYTFFDAALAGGDPAMAFFVAFFVVAFDALECDDWVTVLILKLSGNEIIPYHLRESRWV